MCIREIKGEAVPVKHIVFLDYLRAIACVMVITIHVSANYVVYGKGVYWDIGNFFDGYSRVCVPLFFMISGYFFFNDKQPQTKHFLKVIYALLFYSLFALFVSWVIQFWLKIHVGSNWLQTPAYYHLWYLYRILLIYACAVLVCSRQLNGKHLLMMFLVFFILCNPALNTISKLLGLNTKHFLQIDGSFFYFLLYAVFGGILARMHISAKQAKWLQWIGFCGFVVFGGLIVSLTHYTQPATPFYDYVSPLVALAVMGLFVGFQASESKLKVHSWVSLISKNSLAIYGVHAPLLSIAFLGLQFQHWHPLYTVPLMVVLILVCSLAVSLVIKRLGNPPFK